MGRTGPGDRLGPWCSYDLGGGSSNLQLYPTYRRTLPGPAAGTALAAQRASAGPSPRR